MCHLIFWVGLFFVSTHILYNSLLLSLRLWRKSSHVNFRNRKSSLRWAESPNASIPPPRAESLNSTPFPVCTPPALNLHWALSKVRKSCSSQEPISLLKVWDQNRCMGLKLNSKIPESWNLTVMKDKPHALPRHDFFAPLNSMDKHFSCLYVVF